MSTQSHYEEDRTESTRIEKRYRCPFCNVEYDNELLTRVHITRSDDDLHRNHDGMMPETSVEVLDSDGSVVDQLQRRPNEIDINSLGPDDLPQDFDERKRRSLLVAAYQLNIDTFTKLHERVTAVLEERNLDPVPYNSLRRWVREFYTPQQAGNGAAEDGIKSPTRNSNRVHETLADLTPKQQAVVIHRLAQPGISNGEIASAVGCAKSYPYHVYDRAADIIERLTSELETNTPLEELLIEELDAETIEQFREQGYFESLEIDIDDGRKTSERADADTERNRSDAPTTGPSAKVMTASPTDALVSGSENSSRAFSAESSDSGSQERSSESYKPPASAGEGESDAQSGVNTRERFSDESDRKGRMDAESTGATSAATPSSDESAAVANYEESEVVPKTDLETVTDRVRFLRRVFKREMESAEDRMSERARTQFAITKELEAELEQLLSNESR